MVQVKFFASLRDELGLDACTCELPNPATVGALLDVLQADHGAAAQALVAEGVRIAVNQTLVPIDGLRATELFDAAEVAFLPPVTGG